MRNIMATLILTQLLVGQAAFASASDEEIQVVEIINSLRSDLGVPPLTFDQRLLDAARSYSNDMVEFGFFGSEDQNGISLLDRFPPELSSPKYADLGTTLTDPAAIGNAWTGDPEGSAVDQFRYDNVTDTRYNVIGVGFAPGPPAKWTLMLSASDDPIPVSADPATATVAIPSIALLPLTLLLGGVAAATSRKTH